MIEVIDMLYAIHYRRSILDYNEIAIELVFWSDHYNYNGSEMNFRKQMHTEK